MPKSGGVQSGPPPLTNDIISPWKELVEICSRQAGSYLLVAAMLCGYRSIFPLAKAAYKPFILFIFAVALQILNFMFYSSVTTCHKTPWNETMQVKKHKNIQITACMFDRRKLVSQCLYSKTFTCLPKQIRQSRHYLTSVWRFCCGYNLILGVNLRRLRKASHHDLAVFPLWLQPHIFWIYLMLRIAQHHCS